MKSLIVCNTGSDSLNKINLDTLIPEKISFDLGDKPVGPHSVKVYNDKIITANNYNDSLSIFNLNDLKEERNIKIGPRPNDVIWYDNRIYTICGESNTLVVYNTEVDKVEIDVETGSWPHNIEMSVTNGLIFISNLSGNSVTVLDMETNSVIKTLDTFENPTKLLVSKDGKYLFVCESYLGEDTKGYVEIFSLNNLQSLKKIKVGSSPIDIFEWGDELYVSNLSDGTISVVNKVKMALDNSIRIGGMPKSIIRNGEYIYLIDYLKGRLYIINGMKIEKIIAVETEPNAMIMI